MLLGLRLVGEGVMVVVEVEMEVVLVGLNEVKVPVVWVVRLVVLLAALVVVVVVVVKDVMAGWVESRL